MSRGQARGSPTRVGGANPQYLQNDQHGTAQVAVDSTPRPPASPPPAAPSTPTATPIGTAQSVWPDNRGFLNMPHNPITGLTDIGARKYDPTTGTFISVDPVLDTSNPQQWNPYAYSNNNPITYSDPSGLYCDDCDFQNHKMKRKGTQVGVSCPPCTPNPRQAQLLTADCEELEVELLDPAKQTAVAHNLTVAIVNTYYALVGTQPVLVHKLWRIFPGHADTCTCEGIGDITWVYPMIGVSGVVDQ